MTIGGLEPGILYKFDIVAVNGEGTITAKGQQIAMNTLALPEGGHTVSHTSVSTGASQTIVHANILVPYAFVRVFIGNENCGPPDIWGSTGWEAWPINLSIEDFVCTRYMIEGGYLYRYTGSDKGEADAQWKWTQVAEAPLVQSGYDYTWTAPIGTSTMDTSNYLIQVQGYGPMANVYQPCVESTGGIATVAYCA